MDTAHLTVEISSHHLFHCNVNIDWTWGNKRFIAMVEWRQAVNETTAQVRADRHHARPKDELKIGQENRKP
jgi:hypothetical protein